MSGIPTYRQVLSSPKHIESVAKHAARLLFAIIILGLNAHIIQFSADNVRVYSVVLAVFTILVCTYSIVRLCMFTTMDNVKVLLGMHLFMSLFWLVDIGFVLMLVSQWGEPESVAHFKLLVARAAMGALESVLWFMPMVNLVIAIVDMREHMSRDEDIPMSQIHANTIGLTPITPIQRVEPWGFSTGEPHRTGPQPFLPES